MYPVCSKGNFYYIKHKGLKFPRQETCGKYSVVLVVIYDYIWAVTIVLNIFIQWLIYAVTKA
jgi:hypothetical protein